MITREPDPLLLAPTFLPMRQELIRILRPLDETALATPTACAGWSVRDVALHLLGGDVGLLSRRRDGFTHTTPNHQSFEQLVAFINMQNDIWMRAARRLSPALMLDLMAVTGEAVHQWANSLDPYATGAPVDWADGHPAPLWLEIAREYTEYWHHHQHIADALGVVSLRGKYRAAALAVFAHALPRTYQTADAAFKTVLAFTFPDDEDDNLTTTWYLLRGPNGWQLLAFTNIEPAVHIYLPVDAAWRLFTNGITPAAARSAATVDGDKSLAAPFFDAIAILA